MRNQPDINADKLIKTTDLVDEKNREVLKKLFIDRGHVAHGRPMHILTTIKNYSIEMYIEAVTNLVSGYLQKLEPSQWPVSTGLDIGKSGKHHFSKADN